MRAAFLYTRNVLRASQGLRGLRNRLMGRPHIDRYSFAAISMFVATIGVDGEVFRSVATLRAASMTSQTQAGDGHLFQADRRSALTAMRR